MITFLKIFENKIILNSQRATLLIKCHNENLLNIYEKFSIKNTTINDVWCQTYSGRWWPLWACCRWTWSCSRWSRAAARSSYTGPCPSGSDGKGQFWKILLSLFFKNHSQLSAFVSFFKFSSSFLLSEIHYLPNPLITQLLYTTACSLLTREFVIKNCKKLMWVLD